MSGVSTGSPPPAPRLRRARIAEKGWEADLVVDEVDMPEPVRDQVLVEVEACGICHRDCIDRSGGFAFMRTPITPGHEAVGRVVAVGPRVTDWVVGDRIATMHRDWCGRCPACLRGEVSLCVSAASVLGLLVDGGYATHMVAPQRCFYRMAPAIEAPMAAILHCTFGTAYRAVVTAGALEAGQRCLITGANGGVGVAAIQIAARLGAEVVALVRDERHRALCEDLGATAVIATTDFTGKKIPGGKVHVAVDCVGQPTFPGCLRALQVGGVAVAVGNIVPTKVPINLGFLITFGLRIRGSSGATPTEMAAVQAMHLETPFAMPIAELPGLGGADAAQRGLRAGGLRGRAVLLPGSPD